MRIGFGIVVGYHQSDSPRYRGEVRRCDAMRLLPSPFSSHTIDEPRIGQLLRLFAWSETDRRFKTSSRYVRLKRSMKAFCTGLGGRMYPAPRPPA